MRELLTPYTQVLGLRKAKHLLRRATFNYAKSNIDTISTIITVGQDYVSQGEKVGIALDSRFTDSNERIN